MKNKAHTLHRKSTLVKRQCVLGAACLLFLSSAGQSRADQLAQLTRPVSRVRAKVREIDSSIANLLLNMDNVDPQGLTAANLQETYRLVIRNLYRNSLRTNRPQVAAVMVLKADQLSAGLPAFDRLVAHLLPASANAPGETPSLAVIKGLRQFLRAGRNVNTQLRTRAAIDKYLGKTLGPLGPLIQVEDPSINPDKITVWPVQIPRPNSTPAPVAKGALPAIGQEITWIQGANLTPEMRQALRKILLTLQSQMADRRTEPAAEMYYPVIVRCASLAAHLQAGAALSLATQQQFNHRLLLGLILFRDPRTRAAAVRRLLFINLIVNSLEQLRQANLPTAENNAIKHRIHRAIMKLQMDTEVAKYSAQLQKIGELLRAYRIFSTDVSAPPSAMFRADQIRVRQAGADDFNRLATILAGEYSARDISECIYRLKMVLANLTRLNAMPAAQQQAILYHPASIIGVKANMVRWAKSISKNPDSAGSGAANFDHFQAALNLLAQIHLSMQSLPQANIVRKMSGGRFEAAVRAFLKLQHKLTDSLGTRKVAPDDMVISLNQMRSLFAATAELAILLDSNAPAEKLNRWGGWQVPKRALHLLLKQCEESMVVKYRSITAPAGAMPQGGDQWANFRDASGAVAALYRMTKELNPQLNAKAGLWSTSYLRALTPPPPNAIFGSELGQIALAGRTLAAAEFNHNHGRLTAAPLLFIKCLRMLTAIAPAAK